MSLFRSRSFARRVTLMLRVGRGRVFFSFAFSHTGYGDVVSTRLTLNTVVGIGEVDTGGQRKEEEKRECILGKFHQGILPDWVRGSVPLVCVYEHSHTASVQMSTGSSRDLIS